MKLLLYCTKTKPYITISNDKQRVYPSCVISDGIKEWHLNGKIVAECDYEVDSYLVMKSWMHQEIKIINKSLDESVAEYRNTEQMLDILLKKSCLNIKELTKYMNIECGIGNQTYLYAIHIKNLHIFDKPRELGEYYSDIQRWVEVKAPTIKKAPQNMCYAFDDDMKPYILISIRPEWLCKILNDEKTIEVRKKVLKEMLK